jgi:NhaA family Na+:H+ antiporter
MPHAARDTGLFVEPAPRAHDTLTSFERWWALPVQLVLLLLGLINAGVPLHGLEGGMWAVPVAILIGRPIGVIAAAALGLGAGLHLPRNVRWSDIAVIGCISSIGLTMALFFAAAAMSTGPLQLELKTGALMTAAGAIVAVAAAWLLRVGRFANARPRRHHRGAAILATAKAHTGGK